MKKRLCVCNTYYQLIFVIQMKLSLWKEDSVSVLLSDHSIGAERVAENIKKQNLFNVVDYIQTKDIDQGKHDAVQALIDVLNATLGNCTFWRNENTDLCYDEFLYYNYSVSTETIFSFLAKYNPNIICSRFEEGLVTYNNLFHEGISDSIPSRLQLISKIKDFAHKRKVYEEIGEFYCFHPRYYEGSRKVIEVPLIDIQDEAISEIISQTFDVNVKDIVYPQKYIYFASIGDCEGEKPIGEVDLALKIAEYVGRENLLVKTHPRDTTSAFENAGLIVDKKSSVPWEIIQLNYDFSKHVFLTAVSSSVLSVNLMIDERPETYIMYPLCKNILQNSAVKNAVIAMEKLRINEDRETFNNINVVDDILDIFGKEK